jgi:hypothetical protein
MSRPQVAPAMREAVALGFAECTRQGRGGNADSRTASLWRITYRDAREDDGPVATNEWRKIKTLTEAKNIASAARANKDERAVMFGKSRASKSGNRSKKLNPAPVLETNTDTQTLPVLETYTTGSVRKHIPLSISRVGGREVVAGRLASNPNTVSRKKHNRIAESGEKS